MRNYDEQINFTCEGTIIYSLKSDKAEGPERYKRFREVKRELKKVTTGKILMSFHSL